MTQHGWSSAPGFDDDEYSLRTIKKVSLHKGDVSVVNFGANPTTSAEVKSISDALELLANSDAGDLLEARADDDLVDRARTALDAMRARPVEKSGGMSLRDALFQQGLASGDGPTLSLTDALAQQ